jgi:histone H3/H4
MDLSTDHWRKCSSCKKEIKYKSAHFVCSVSTCTRKRTGYVFCSVHCWERHLPGARHRDAAAIEAVSPSFDEWKRELSEAGVSSTPAASPAQPIDSRTPQKVIVRPTQPSGSVAAPVRNSMDREILVVASKLKTYIRERSEMNTSDSVMEVLSHQLRRLCDDAIDRARAAGRKTVMDRDFTD